MVCATLLFFTVILAVSKVTALHCSDQQLPVSGDGMPDAHEAATTLQYCLTDNCTIVSFDTGEELEIVYTTDSVLVVTPRNVITSLLIVKLENELPCVDKALDYDDGLNILMVIVSVIMMVVSGCTAVIHLVDKQLRSIVGKLLILYSLSVICMCIAINALFFVRYKMTIYTQILCDIITFTFKLASISLEVFATCILTHLAYVMYRGSKLKPEMSRDRSNLLLKCYITYEIFTLLLTLILAVLYNLLVNSRPHIFLPNDHCRLNITLKIITIPTTFNKVAQILMFLIYLYYSYKLGKKIHNAGMPSRQQSHLSKIAISIGATVGISHFIYVIYLAYNLPVVELCFGVFLVQQCVIMASSLSMKKMHQLCKCLP